MPAPQSNYRSEDLHATVPESCAPQEVFLLVYPPRNNDATRHDLHWSLAWEISDGHWKYVQVNVRREGEESEQTPHAQYCDYCGACTRNENWNGVGARLCSLGRLSLQARKRIEEVAHFLPFSPPGGLWSCQHWILGVLRRLADNGMISQRILEDTVGYAYNAWNDVLSP